MKEIATLELQILQLESYLLSLYRTAFQHHVPVFIRDHETHIKDRNRSNLKITAFPPYYEMGCAISPSDFSNHDRFFHSRSLPCSNDQTKAAPNSASGMAVDVLPQLQVPLPQIFCLLAGIILSCFLGDLLCPCPLVIYIVFVG